VRQPDPDVVTADTVSLGGALWDRDEFLELAERSAGIGVWDVELATGTVRARPQFFRLMGLEPTSEPISIETFRALRHPDDRARVVGGFQHALTQGKDTYESEYRIVRPDGEVRWILGRGRVVRDTSGVPIRYSGVDIDITDRKRIEAALRAAEARFLHVFQLAPVAMTISTLHDGRYIDVNAALLSQTGHSREEMVGRTAMEVGVYFDPADFVRVRTLLAERGSVKNLEMRLKGKHAVRTVLLNADIVELGHEPCLLTASVDITDRKAAEAALVQSEARYRAMVDNANDIVATLDLDFRFTSVNPAVTRILGYAPEEILGTPLSRLVPEQQLPMHQSMLQRKLGGETATQYEMELLGKDGRHFTLEVSSTLIFDGAGNPTAIHAIARDVTERKDAEARQLLLVRELQHRAKNILAVMQSIISSTLKSSRDLQSGHDAVLGRLHALARAQEFIASGPGVGASIREIVEAELTPFAGRVQIEGPMVVAGSAFAQMFAIVVHELGTNATKYGSLSVPNGGVSIRWAIAGPTFEFSWIERGGPPVRTPTSLGFGSTLINAVLIATPRISFAESGLEYEIAVPLADVLGRNDALEAAQPAPAPRGGPSA
jgi:PAS domain S-box-containing protein